MNPHNKSFVDKIKHAEGENQIYAANVDANTNYLKAEIKKLLLKKIIGKKKTIQNMEALLKEANEKCYRPIQGPIINF